MSGRRHDHDAGGDADLLAAKAGLRERIWDALRDAGAARFPVAHGRIPNFTGAEAAADRLRELEVWQRALEDGKTVFMAVPRLAEEQPFFLLDPDTLTDSPRRASSIKGASAHARTVGVDELEPVDLVIAGCVAVSSDGARLGKGGGFSDPVARYGSSFGIQRHLHPAWRRCSSSG